MRGRVQVRFEEYVATRGAALLRLATVLTGHRHDGEDLAQAALADAYRHWARVERAEDPDAYVRRILVNRHLTGRRRRWWGERPSGADPGPGGELAGSSDPVAAVADRSVLRAALDGLTPRARAVLVLRYYADLDDQTIGAMTGLTPGSVRSTASRALAELRRSPATAALLGSEDPR